MRATMLINVFVLWAYLPLFAQGGLLDQSFGVTGAAIVVTAGTTQQFEYVAQAVDGKIYGVGYSVISNEFKGLIVRLNEDGTQDNSFGNNSSVVIGEPGENFIPEGVELNNDDKPMVYGSIEAGALPKAVVYRLNTDGTPDQSLNGTGKLELVLPNSLMKTESIRSIPNSSDFYMGVRINDNVHIQRRDITGSLMANWGVNGEAVIDLTDAASVVEILRDPSGMLYGCGMNHIINETKMAVTTFDSNGDLYTNFGTNGTTSIDLFTDSERTEAATLQDDGKILCVGYRSVPGGEIGSIHRLNTDGSVDLSFGVNGSFDINLYSGNERLTGVEYIDNKIYVCGRADDGNGNDLFVGSLNYNGTWNTVFGSGVGYEKHDIWSSLEIDNIGAMIRDLQLSFLIAGGTKAAGNGDLDGMIAKVLSGLSLSMQGSDWPIHDLEVYPDPAVINEVTLNFKVNVAQDIRISIYEQSGKLIETIGSISGTTGGEQSIQLALPATLANGTYLIGVDNGSITRFKSIRILK